MESLERHAFWRGYKDCQTYLLRRNLRRLTPFDSGAPVPWWPPKGHENAYSLGWAAAMQRWQGQESAGPSRARSVRSHGVA